MISFSFLCLSLLHHTWAVTVGLYESVCGGLELMKKGGGAGGGGGGGGEVFRQLHILGCYLFICLLACIAVSSFLNRKSAVFHGRHGFRLFVCLLVCSVCTQCACIHLGKNALKPSVAEQTQGVTEEADTHKTCTIKNNLQRTVVINCS